MLRKICYAAALTASALASAQQADSARPSNTEAAAASAPAPAIYGFFKDGASGGSAPSDFCRLDQTKDVPSGGMVVVVRKVACTSRYGASFIKSFLEVLFRGRKMLVDADSIYMTDESARKFEVRDSAQVEASASEWELASLSATKHQLEKALGAVKATAKYGIAILNASIFDVSEYTEGTGFKVTVHNSGRKTIKYVTFSVVGLNAVKDPVRDRLHNTTSPMLRGIGPIESGESGTYSKDYMWMTDVVESFRISQIKLEFTDGTSKVLTDTKSLRISVGDYEMLAADLN